jgi:predicted metalloprotease with PDZ domain
MSSLATILWGSVVTLILLSNHTKRFGQAPPVSTNVPQAAHQAPTGQAREQFSLKVDGLTIHFTLEGERIVALKDQIAQTTQNAFGYYLKLFGKAPQQALGEKYTSVPIDIKQGAKWEGEVEGHHIHMSFDPKPDASLPAPYATPAFIKIRWQAILAHEIFHLWNAKSFRYSSGKEQWFNEGSSQYYTFRGLKRTGAMDDKTFFFALQTLWEMYCTDKGLGVMSMREAGLTKQRHTGLVEGGGLFVAVCLDITIRKSTENRKSLDDLMRILFEEFNSTDKLYDMEKLMAIVKRLTGGNEEDFFRKHVDGRERIPIIEYLQRAGLAVKMDPSGTKIEIAMKSEMDKLEQRILSGILGDPGR